MRQGIDFDGNRSSVEMVQSIVLHWRRPSIQRALRLYISHFNVCRTYFVYNAAVSPKLTMPPELWDFG